MSLIARKRRRPAALAAIGLTGLAAVAALPAGADVRPDRNVSVFHNLNFVALSGYAENEALTISVDRPGVGNIASLTANARPGEAPGTFGFEINHGVDEPPAQPGDCWETYVPDILPGDTVSVTDSAAVVDSTVVDDIQITKGLHLVGQDVVYEGVALRADGTPIDVGLLDSGEVRADGASPRVRAVPTDIVPIPGVPGGWRAIHERSAGYGAFVGADTSLDHRRDALLDFGDPAMGYGHIEPAPPVVQLVEGLDEGGAALGCPEIPLERNSIEGADREAINAANAGTPLVVNGRAASDVVDGNDVDVSLNGTPVDAAVIAVDTAARTWTATIPAGSIPAADAPVTIEADFPGSQFDTQPGARVSKLTLDKDTGVPAGPTGNPAPGTYVGSRTVTLSAEDGATIHYTNDGSAPTTGSTQATGGIPVTASQTLRAIAVDAAGNVSDVAVLPYTITQPAAQQPAAQQPAGPAAAAPAPIAPAGSFGSQPGGSSSAQSLALGSLTTTGRITARRARSNGLRLVMRLQEGTEVVQVRIYRRTSSGRKLISSGFRSTGGRTGLYRLKQNHRSLRRSLKAGRYVVEVTPGASRTDLGRTSRYNVRVVR